MESAAIARQFVEGLNAFDGASVGALLTDDFEFTIGTHSAGRDDFLASLASGPDSDPQFTFAIERIDGTDVHGRQEYHWRETRELATSAARVLRLELDGDLIRRATVDDAP